MSKKLLSKLLSICILIGMAGIVNVDAESTTVVISQVYGGGGNSGAVLANDFIELYNCTGNDISLNGYTVAYASATGVFPTTGTNVHTLTGTIKAYGYYLLQEAAGSTGSNSGTMLSAPDETGTLSMGGKSGKVKLADASKATVDIVGYGTGVTGGEGNPACGTALTNAQSAIRKPVDSSDVTYKTTAPQKGNGQDTDSNSDDFTIETAAPRNSSVTVEGGSTGETVEVSGVSLDKSNITICIGEIVTLTATVTPSNATNKTVNWTSSAPAVATVNNGVVTAVSPGSTTVTATTQDGSKTASCAVTVQKNETPSQGNYQLLASMDFEPSVSTIGYNTTTVAINGYACEVKNAYGTMDTNDKKTGTGALRFNPYRTSTGDATSPGVLAIKQNFSGITKIEFNAAMYSSHANNALKVELYQSKDNGASWTLINTFENLVNSGFTAYAHIFDTPQPSAMYKFTVEKGTAWTVGRSANIDDIKFYQTVTSTTVTAPQFTPNGGEIEEGTTVSINTTTPDAAISYTIYDGADTSAAVLTQNQAYTGAFDPFSGAAGESVTVSAKATKAGMTDSDTTTVTYKKPNLKTIEEIRELGVVTGVTTYGVVSYINGQYNFVQSEDGSAGIVLYGAYSNISVGDKIKIRGDVVLYSGLLEFSGATVTKLESIIPPAPITTTIDDIMAGKYDGMYIRLESVVVGETTGTAPNTSTTIRSGQSTMTIFKMPSSASDGTTINQGDTIDVSAGVTFHSSTNQQLLTSSELISKVEGILAPPYVSSSTTLGEGELASLACSTTGAVIYYTIYSIDEDTEIETDESGLIEYTDSFNPFDYTPEADKVIVKAYSSKGEDKSDTVSITFRKLTLSNIAYVRTLTDKNPVIIQGIITRKDGSTYYIQDITGGIAVYTTAYALTPGDEVKISGTLGFRYGAAQITPDSVEIIGNGMTVEPKVVTVVDLLAKKYQGELVKLEKVTIGTQSGNYLPLTDSNGKTINAFTQYNKIDNVASGDKVNVIGVISIYDGANPTYVSGTPQIIVVDAASNVTKVSDDIVVEGLGLYNGNQKLTGFIKGATVTAKATVSNYTQDIASQTAAIIVAMYGEGNKLISTVISDSVSVAQNTSGTPNVPFTVDPNTAEIKIMIVEGLNNIKPLTEFVELAEYVAPPATLKVSFLDVGQADSMVIESGGQVMLLDAGADANGGKKVLSYLKSQGITNLDYVVASHGHSDHIGGMPTVIGSTDITIGEILVSPKPFSSVPYNAFLTAVQNKGKTITLAQRGDSFVLGAATVEVLSAKNTGSGTSSASVNQSSIMLKITFGSKSFLFTGDCETPVDSETVAYWGAAKLKADVLKVAHHGSNDSSAQEFLNAISPSYSVIEVGAGNPYGHPQANALTRLQSISGNTILRTDLNGDITFTTDGNTLDVSVSKGNIARVLKFTQPLYQMAA